MKRIILFLCTALAVLCGTNKMYAQHTPSVNTPRSEQFILDSMRMEVEKKQIDTQYKMYADSMGLVAEIESDKINLEEDKREYLIPVSFFLSIIVIIWLSLNYSRRKKKDRYQIIEKALDKGESLPQSIFDEPQKRQKTWLNTLRSGVVTLCCGLGVFGLGFFTEEVVFMGLALIPSFIGLGYLLVAFLEHRHEKRQNMLDKESKPVVENETEIHTPDDEENL